MVISFCQFCFVLQSRWKACSIHCQHGSVSFFFLVCGAFFCASIHDFSCTSCWIHRSGSVSALQLCPRDGCTEADGFPVSFSVSASRPIPFHRRCSDRQASGFQGVSKHENKLYQGDQTILLKCFFSSVFKHAVLAAFWNRTSPSSFPAYWRSRRTPSFIGGFLHHFARAPFFNLEREVSLHFSISFVFSVFFRLVRAVRVRPQRG